MDRLWTQAGVFLLALLCGCISGPTQEDNTGKLQVVATIYPLYEMSKAVGADKAKVTLLIPPGSEIHTFEPTPQSAMKLEQADLFITNGLGLEHWAERLVSASGNMKLTTLDASSGITPLNLSGGGYDPHVFQDPLLATAQLDNVLSAYIRKDPANSEYYSANARRYREQLLNVSGDYENGLANCSIRIILVNHPFLGYPAVRYGFKQIALSGSSPEAELLPLDLQKAATTARANAVKYVVYESTVSPKNAQTLADEANLTVVAASTAHEITVEDYNAGRTYINLLEQDLQVIRKVMDCE